MNASGSTVLIASDLDRTLIYSEGALALSEDELPPLTCVEIYNGKPASFMTDTAATLTVSLAEFSVFVPVTTRIPDQLARVTLPGPPPAYAVAANGGVLFAGGVRDEVWDKQIAHQLTQSMPLSEVLEHVGQVCRPEWTSKLRNAEGLFCYAVIDRAMLPVDFVDEVTEWASERGWTTSLQGGKLYWVPKTLTKSAAVAEVAARIGADLVLSAGDSLLDIDLLVGADRGIHPAHGEIFDSNWSAPHILCTEAVGILAGQEILEWFLSAARAAVGRDEA
jgi:hypothetical protein